MLEVKVMEEELDQEQVEIRKKQVYQAAKSPGSKIFIILIFFYMLGSSISIWSIGFVVMTILNGFKSLFTFPAIFRACPPKEVDLRLPKVIYITLSAIPILLALYKSASFGLLPGALDTALFLPTSPTSQFASF